MQAPLLGLIDYGSGNLRSVSNALAKIGARVELLDSPERLGDVDAVVLPGVGAFGDCAGQLRQRGLWDPIADWLQADRPFLGVCLGYQLLFDSSEETPGVPGFGRFRGKGPTLFLLPASKCRRSGGIRSSSPNPMPVSGADSKTARNVYFVHSYYPVPADPHTVAATTDYGQPFAAAIEAGNTMGVQFHPEKSQEAGLTMLRNFVESIQHKDVRNL